MKLALFVACNQNGGIGYQNALPWHLPADLRRFRDITTYTEKKRYRNALIMGRHTWESIGQRPLSHRLNIVISKTLEPIITKDLWVAPSIKDALYELEKEKHFDYNIETVFLIGGSQIYQEGIQHPDCERIYLTEVKYDGECDTFFPIEDFKKFHCIYESAWSCYDNIEYKYKIYNQNKKDVKP